MASKLSTLFAELKRREVSRVAVPCAPLARSPRMTSPAQETPGHIDVTPNSASRHSSEPTP